MYGSLDASPARLSSRALTLVHDYREAMDKVDIQSRPLATTWTLPKPRLTKLNFDASSRQGTSYGWGFVPRNSEGEVLCGGTMQGESFMGAEVEEARARRFAL